MLASDLNRSQIQVLARATAPPPSSSLRREPQQARSRERIARVLDAAERLLASEGADALTTTRIAEEAGISVSSLYQYFPDKGAIVDALARKYMDEFEGLMADLVRRDQGNADLVASLIDAFAERYRSQPGYRALWFGPHLSEQLREADRRNREALADGVRRMLLERRAVRDGPDLLTSCRTAVLTAHALLQEAFLIDATGDPALLAEAKRILRCYLDDVVTRHATEKGPDR